MKFFTSTILFAAYALAIPSASPDAMAEAISSAQANPGFLQMLCSKNSLFGLRGAYGGGSGSNSNNNNSNGNSNNNNNKLENIIYIVPGGYITNGNTVTGSIPFTGTIVNGVLYVNQPNFSNGLGTVKVNNSGQLQVVEDGNGSGSSANGNGAGTNGNGGSGNTDTCGSQCSTANWMVQADTIKPNGVEVISCPDAKGNHYLYAGVKCPGGSTLTLKTNNHSTWSAGNRNSWRWW